MTVSEWIPVYVAALGLGLTLGFVWRAVERIFTGRG
jgi:hypothetical protein